MSGHSSLGKRYVKHTILCPLEDQYLKAQTQHFQYCPEAIQRGKPLIHQTGKSSVPGRVLLHLQLSFFLLTLDVIGGVFKVAKLTCLMKC